MRVNTHGDREADREGPELERPPFPHKAQPLPVFVMYQDVEEGLQEKGRQEKGSPMGTQWEPKPDFNT